MYQGNISTIYNLTNQIKGHSILVIKIQKPGILLPGFYIFYSKILATLLTI